MPMGATEVRSAIGLDSATGLHVIIRLFDDPVPAGGPTLSAILRAGEAADLLGCVDGLDSLYPSRVKPRAVTIDELFRMLADGRITRSVPDLMQREGRLLQARFSRGRRSSVAPTPEQLAHCGGGFVTIEPLVDWALAANLIVLALALGSEEAWSAILGEYLFDDEVRVPICHNPGYRLTTPYREGPLEVSSALPLLASVLRSGELDVVQNSGTRMLELRARGTRESISEGVLVGIDRALGASRFELDGRTLAVPDGVAAKLWDCAVRRRDLRVYVCQNCGRLAAGPARGNASKYCSNACRADRARAEGRWASAR